MHHHMPLQHCQLIPVDKRLLPVAGRLARTVGDGRKSAMGSSRVVDVAVGESRASVGGALLRATHLRCYKAR